MGIVYVMGPLGVQASGWEVGSVMGHVWVGGKLCHGASKVVPHALTII